MAVSVIIVQNSKGELYAHKRSPNKKTFPNLYGLGAGGRLEGGETPLQAAQRELNEELNIKPKLKFLFAFNYKNTLLNVFYTIYDGEISGMNEEFSWVGWMTTEELDKLVNEKKLMPDTEIFYKRFKMMELEKGKVPQN